MNVDLLSLTIGAGIGTVINPKGSSSMRENKQGTIAVMLSEPAWKSALNRPRLLDDSENNLRNSQRTRTARPASRPAGTPQRALRRP